ncbi:TMEM175 family protein [Ferruginibacter sp. SUN106]|uniref:TMEM175 family protein n=1 Tax=Ferruginibacter sp. SUN106 TaxID=2978348 RepID=UPI003D35C126
MNELHNELKKEFQIERMILFSDAVFAIAITLMAIEIKVPVIEEHGVTDHELLKALGHLVFKFIGFIISFFIIGLYWTVHHRMFSFVENYNNKLLWLNLIFLLSIVLMPFSSGLYGEYSNKIDVVVPYTVYVFNICLTGYLNYRLWKYIGNPKNNIASHTLTRDMVSISIKRSLVTPAIFLLSLVATYFVSVSLWIPVIGRYFPMFIPLVMKRIQNKHNKKTTPVAAATE